MHLSRGSPLSAHLYKIYIRPSKGASGSTAISTSSSIDRARINVYTSSLVSNKHAITDDRSQHLLRLRIPLTIFQNAVVIDAQSKPLGCEALSVVNAAQATPTSI